MKKILIAICLMMITYVNLFSQDKLVNEEYLKYRGYRNAVDEKPKFISKMIKLLSDSSQLTLVQRTNIQFHIGRMYEEIDNPDSAIIYYEKSLKGEPDYEVIHRALAFYIFGQN